MLVGVLLLVVYALGHQQLATIWRALLLTASFFFLTYGFVFDIYRLKFLRSYIIINYSLSSYKTLVLLLSLLPLYFCLIEAIILLLDRRFHKHFR